jgi:hypothetical protein
MHGLSSDFVARNPECLDVKDSLALMLVLSEHDPVGTLRDLLSLTTIAEREYARLPQYRIKTSESVT